MVVNAASTDWHPTAAYFYVLQLDNPALAWEYLRRNPDYRRDWIHHAKQPAIARRWRLCWMEDPALDARDAHPCWVDEAADTTYLTGARASPDATAFGLWRLPGRKSLQHDGQQLLLTIQIGHRRVCMTLDDRVIEGKPAAYLVRAGAGSRRDWKTIEAQQRLLKNAPSYTAPRPDPHTLLHMRDLQALDGQLAGASHREIAERLFGELIAQQWANDGDLRARVRRGVNRARRFMQGGYHRLLTQSRSAAHGRFSETEKRP